MKTAVIQGSNSGFFPNFYASLRQSGCCNDVSIELFSPYSGVNRRKRLDGQHTFGTPVNWHIHNRIYKITGKHECYSHFSTWNLIRQLKQFNPDVIHLHVINQMQLNVPMLINYINEHHIPVVWTFHDCRAFTGGCPYFDEVGCEEWKTGCRNCPLKKGKGVYLVGNTKWQWNFYKKWFTSIENLNIVTPSKWLANFVKESFLKDKPCQVIYNGVDTERFSVPSSFDVRKTYGIEDKKIILGCAINWEMRKGLKFFEQIAGKLPSNYQIVLVGGINETYKARLESKGIIITGRTKTFDEMAAWYQQASVFVNPTLADNFPTTNIESLAAGTPIVTFRTGGSPEAIDEKTGIVVDQGDVDGLENAMIKIIENANSYSSENCQERSKLFSNAQYDEYIKIYHSLCEK